MKGRWPSMRFESVLGDVSAGSLKTLQSDFLSSGRFPIVDQGKELIAGYSDDESRVCLASLPVIVFGDHTRCFKYVDFPFCIGADGVKVFRPIIDADPKYLYHFLRQVPLTEGGYSRHYKYLKRVEIPLPPLPEQRRIAAILDQAESLRAKRRAALALLDELTQAIFLEMFGDPATNPKGWPVKAFGEVCESRLGKMLDRKQQTGKHLRPYLRNANVRWFGFELGSLFEMDFDAEARQEFELRPGDLLICEGGEPGRAAVWDGAISDCYFQKALHRARPDKRLAHSEFLAWVLWFLAQRGRLVGVTSATIAHLTGEKLAVLPVILPPIDLQARFGKQLARVHGLRATLESANLHLDTLFASLQYRAFRGEL